MQKLINYVLIMGVLFLVGCLCLTLTYNSYQQRINNLVVKSEAYSYQKKIISGDPLTTHSKNQEWLSIMLLPSGKDMKGH